MPSRLRSALALAGILALIAAPSASALLDLTLSTPASAPIVVGYAPGELSAATALLHAVGATLVDRVDALDVLVVTAPLGVDSITSLTSPTGALRFAEPLFGTAASAAQWDGAQWDAAQWDGAQWDGSPTAAPAADPALALGWQWGLLATQATSAWPQEPATTARACLVDSGVNAHPDLPAPLATYNAITGGSNVTDEAGHGTHMAGIVAATRANGLGVSGVGHADLLVAKIFDATGHGKDTDLARGIVWCASQSADVILLALSVDGNSQLIARALDYAQARDVVVVASAGNTGGDVTFPASYPSVIAVAATNPWGGVPAFSSRGPSVALAAPGVRVLSTFGTDAYAYGSGTSQAAAFVAGAASVLRESRPGLAPASVRSALVTSARDLGTPGRDDATGAGLLNVPAALAAASKLG